MKSNPKMLCLVLAALALSTPALAQDPHQEGIAFDKEAPKLVRVVDAAVKAGQEMKQEMVDLGATDQSLKEVQFSINMIQKNQGLLSSSQVGIEDLQLRQIGFIASVLKSISTEVDGLFESKRRQYCHQAYSNVESSEAVLVERTTYTAKTSTAPEDAAKYCQVERQGTRFF